MGLKERVWGQMGVRRIAGISGWTRDPPADREYAVEPVGVEKMHPSAWTTVRSSLSPYNSKLEI